MTIWPLLWDADALARPLIPAASAPIAIRPCLAPIAAVATVYRIRAKFSTNAVFAAATRANVPIVLAPHAVIRFLMSAACAVAMAAPAKDVMVFPSQASSLMSAKFDSKCSFNQVADSDETSLFPVTLPAEEASLIRNGSTPSISGISTVAYKSRMLEGAPCA